MTDGGDGAPGHRHSEDARRRIGAAWVGRSVSVEHRKRIAAAHRGKALSSEHRRKLSARKTGITMKPRTQEHCQRISEGCRLAWQHRRLKLAQRTFEF